MSHSDPGLLLVPYPALTFHLRAGLDPKEQQGQPRCLPRHAHPTRTTGTSNQEIRKWWILCAATKLKTFYFPVFASCYHGLIRLLERKFDSVAIPLDTKTSAPQLYPHTWPQIVQSHETIKKSIKSPLQNLNLTPKVPNSS